MGSRSLRAMVGVAVLAVVAAALITACNPVGGVTVAGSTNGFGAIESFHFDGTADGWVEIRMTKATPSPTTTKFSAVVCVDCPPPPPPTTIVPPDTEITASIAVSVDHEVACIGDNPDHSDATVSRCVPSGNPAQAISPPRVLWSLGATTGFRRFIRVSAGELVVVHLSEPTSTTIDIAVVDDAGHPLGGNVVLSHEQVAPAII